MRMILTSVLLTLSLLDPLLTHSSEPDRSVNPRGEKAATTIPIALRDNFPILEATVDGIDVPLKFDLGDGTPLVLQQSVLDRIKAVPTGEVARFQGINGPFETPLYKVARLQIGDVLFTDVEARPDVRDPSYLAGASGEKGYLGTGLLKSYQLKIDYSHLAMTLMKDSCTGTVVPFAPKWNGEPVTEATTDQGPVMLWWDTGSPVSALRKTFVKGARLQSPNDGLHTKLLSLGGTDFGPWQFQLWDLKLPGFDGFIGFDFFAKHVVCVDFPNQRLLIEPAQHEVTASSKIDADIDALMQRYAGGVPGAALLVIQDGAAVVGRGFGFADLEQRVAVTPQTNFRLASVTKQFTAAAILLLAEDGRLRLDDPVHRWLPTLPEAAAMVTIRQLLTHTSGLIDYEDVIPATMTAQLHDLDVLSILEMQDRTYFAPGTNYRYSNSGYALLALIVGRTSGQDFASFLRSRVFMPLGMTGTVAHEDGVSTVAHRAYGYSETAAGWSRTDQSQTSAVLGDGGIYSSIDDLAKWDAALYDDRLLGADSRRQAFAAATPTDDPGIGYGFGWRITGETLWHSGETMGFRNVIVRYPERRMTVVLLTNRNDPEPYRTALAIAALFLNQ